MTLMKTPWSFVESKTGKPNTKWKTN